VTLGGVVAAGKFLNANVKVYDATVGEVGTPVATGTTAADGTYSVPLPAGFSKPVLIVVSAKADGSSHVVDEVYGDQSMPATFILHSVVPSGAYAGSALTGYVTPYTDLMYNIVKAKLGKPDVDAAISQARNAVTQLTGNLDPLDTDPVKNPGMVTKLAAVSNIAKGTGANDPDGCASKATAAEKIECTVGTLGKTIAAMGADDDTGASANLALDQGIVTALADADDRLVGADIKQNNPDVESDADGLDGERDHDKARLDDLVMNDHLFVPDTATASGITQAKAFFASLRTGILPYANDTQTGFLYTEGKKLQAEFNQLHHASVSGLNEFAKIVSWAVDLHSGTVPPQCAGTIASATCSHSNQYGILDQVAMTNSGTAWSMNAGTLTGTIAFDASGNQLTMDGYIPPMTSAASKARVGNPGGGDANATSLKVTRTALAGQADMYHYKFEGSIKDLTDDGAPVFELALGAGTYFDHYEPANGLEDKAKITASFTGNFITANYQFIGQIDASKLQGETVTYGTPPHTWTDQEILGGTASFTGTVNGRGLTGVDANAANDFNLLVGKLEGTVDRTNFDPLLADSATNFRTGTLTFTGTVFKSAADPGLKLVMSVTETGWNKGTLTVSYNDYNKGISVTGSEPYDEHSAATQYLTLVDGNGISVKSGTDSTSVVMKGASQLGDIDGGRITYMDGTFESLL